MGLGSGFRLGVHARLMYPAFRSSIDHCDRAPRSSIPIENVLPGLARLAGRALQVGLQQAHERRHVGGALPQHGRQQRREENQVGARQRLLNQTAGARPELMRV